MELGGVPVLASRNLHTSSAERLPGDRGAVAHLVEATGQPHEYEWERQEEAVPLLLATLKGVDLRVPAFDQVVPKDPWIPPDESLVGPEAGLAILPIEDDLAIGNADMTEVRACPVAGDPCPEQVPKRHWFLAEQTPVAAFEIGELHAFGEDNDCDVSVSFHYLSTSREKVLGIPDFV